MNTMFSNFKLTDDLLDGDFKMAEIKCNFTDPDNDWIDATISFWINPNNEIDIIYIGIKDQITIGGNHIDAVTIRYDICIYRKLVRDLETAIAAYLNERS